MKISKLSWPVIPALLLLCLSLTACTSEPPKSPPVIIQEPLPESLTAKTDVPSPPARPMTWGGLAIWTDSLLDALDTCNADKAGIRELELRRIARGMK
ncbi:peptidase [Klebsiella pneumoniae]|nr:peptidase [Klebsiella pneumoniae]PLM10236.1 peptidase [Klebsiella pneumoniae]PLM17277.1 peptidase [Klebsiella pneumoniae]PLN67957.1 peptidase [Klebsiella pneumoniae]PLN96766.1 peptidase [Klebsiella pneumoniae]